MNVSLFLFFILSSCLIACNQATRLKEKPIEEIKNEIRERKWARWSGLEPVMRPQAIFDNVHVEPGSIVQKDTTQYLFYSGFDGHTWRIGFATSADGLTWQRQRLILDKGLPGEFDQRGVKDPFVLFENGKFYMWYTGIGDLETTTIGFAESKDAINWEKKSQALSLGYPDEFDSHSVSRPTVIQAANQYIMYYVGSDGTTYQINTAVSQQIDALQWDKNYLFNFTNSSLFIEDGQFSTAVYFDNDTQLYHLWVTGLNGTKKTIGKAVSGDGFTFALNPSAQFLDVNQAGSSDDEQVYSPAFYTNHLGKYVLLYAGNDGTNSRLHVLSCVEFAEPADCMSDLANPNNPQWPRGGFIDFSASLQFDSLEIKNPAVAFRSENKQHYLFYNGFDGNSTRLGLAKSTDGINWQRYGTILLSGPAGSFDESEIGSSSVLFDEVNQKFKVYYEAIDASANTSLGYVESTDATGEVFQNRVQVLNRGGLGSFDSQSIRNPTMILAANQYTLYYLASNGSEQVLAKATSSDGLVFANRQVVHLPVDNNDIKFTRLVQVVDTLYLFYQVIVDQVAEIHWLSKKGSGQWKQRGAVLTSERFFENQGIESMGVLPIEYEDDLSVDEIKPVFRMWYSAFDGTYRSLGLAIFQ